MSVIGHHYCLFLQLPHLYLACVDSGPRLLLNLPLPLVHQDVGLAAVAKSDVKEVLYQKGHEDKSFTLLYVGSCTLALSLLNLSSHQQHIFLPSLLLATNGI